MKNTPAQKLLFVVNPGSGSNEDNYSEIIRQYFSTGTQDFEIHELPANCTIEKLKIMRPDCISQI